MNTWALCYIVSLLSSVSITWIYLVHQPMIGLNENSVILNLRYLVACSGGLSLKVSHVPTKLFSYSQSSAEQQEKIRKKTPNQLMG